MGSFQTLCFLKQYLKASTFLFLFPPFKLPSTLHISKPWTQCFKTLNASLFFFLFFFFFSFLPNQLERTSVPFFFFLPLLFPLISPLRYIFKTHFFSFFIFFPNRLLPLSLPFFFPFFFPLFSPSNLPLRYIPFFPFSFFFFKPAPPFKPPFPLRYITFFSFFIFFF